MILGRTLIDREPDFENRSVARLEIRQPAYLSNHELERVAPIPGIGVNHAHIIKVVRAAAGCVE